MLYNYRYFRTIANRNGFMKTECTKKYDTFQPLGRKEIVAECNGGLIISDGGCRLLGDVEKRTAILQRFAKSFTDYRDKNRIEHSYHWYPKEL